jgi:hypothetical protein
MRGIKSFFFVIVSLLLNVNVSAQVSSCSDDFSTSHIGENKTWTFVDKDNASGGTARIFGEQLSRWQNFS